jgi:FkbM family methyltransferase
MTMTSLHFLTRASNKLTNEVYKFFNKDALSGLCVHPIPALEKIGSECGGWIVPTNSLNRESICYCVGVGEDITFDLALIDRFGCQVFAYDPTPRAALHVKSHAVGYDKYIYKRMGLWDKDEVIKFYAPANPDNVSHSAINLQKTDTYFEAQCKRLSTLLSENVHERISLLKLDIEGAEYKVVESILSDHLKIDILCVEYDEAFHPLDRQYKERITTSVKSLLNYGYRLVATGAPGNYTFIKDGN